MREIDKIIIHCSDSDIKTHQDISVIEDWHIQRGFKKVGYHYFINWSGDIQIGRDESEVGAHCLGYNDNSIGICLGGRYIFTDVQINSLKTLLYELLKKYNLYTNDVYGHNYFDKTKTCPNFNIKII